jgi:hypothetical protein
MSDDLKLIAMVVLLAAFGMVCITAIQIAQVLAK